MLVLKLLAMLVRNLLASRAALAAENLALRHQLGVLRRSVKRPRLRRSDRLFWVWLSRVWRSWRSCLIVVKPATAIRWHRECFRLYWHWKSRSNKVGRRPLDVEVRQLIRRTCRENPTWGAPRIQSELALLGHDVAESSVAKYMVRGRKPPSQTWRTFLGNHVDCLASIDFFTVVTVTFRVPYVFVVLCHDRRGVAHFNVTEHPTAAWTAQQIVQAFPYDEAPRFLIRDRDGIYGEDVQRRIQNMGIEEVLIAPRSPWQTPYVERAIGSVRRECLNHVIVFSDDHLRRILESYLAYYHGARTHLSLDRNAPEPRRVESRPEGRVVAIPHVGGLHHRYTRAA